MLEQPFIGKCLKKKCVYFFFIKILSIKNKDEFYSLECQDNTIIFLINIWYYTKLCYNRYGGSAISILN